MSQGEGSTARGPGGRPVNAGAHCHRGHHCLPPLSLSLALVFSLTLHDLSQSPGFRTWFLYVSQTRFASVGPSSAGPASAFPVLILASPDRLSCMPVSL